MFSGGSSVTIGRSSSNHIAITNDKFMSRIHAKIEVRDSIPFIVDAGTRTGTLLNDQKVTLAPLKPGDIVQLAQTKFRFEGNN